ncbi:replication protein RepA [Azospirillum sp. Sh1]|uniref:replication protein RepA n=1 Tax=Azospirillum sp. Sh1 TaxID=2607285 RepID=UPI0032B4A3BF
MMGQIHQLILTHGHEEARRLAGTEERRYVDLAAAFMSADLTGIGTTYTGFCMMGLPHKALGDSEPWERKGPRITLLIEPGHLYENGERKLYGVPYGSRARLILIYLQTQAMRTNCPEIELGRSMREWMERMGVQTGGKNYRDVREQANRISACTLSFHWGRSKDHAPGFRKDNIVEGGIQLYDQGDDDQPRLWVDTVRLSDKFFAELKNHHAPLVEAAIRQISNQSLAIDIYTWLAFRLHSLETDTPITWAALHGQFGAGYKLLRQFRARFLESLKAALAVYPEARISVTEQGLTLIPSPPPVRPKVTALA